MGQPARDFTCFVVAGRNLPLVDTARGPGPANAYCALSLLNPGDAVPEEGLVTENPRGTPTSAVTSSTNPVIFNSEVVMRKQVVKGSSLLITVWHRAAPGSGQKGDLKLGKVLVPLPVEGPHVILYTLSDDSGVAVMGTGGGYAGVDVQIVLPGQVRPPVPTNNVQATMIAQQMGSQDRAPATVGGAQKPSTVQRNKEEFKGYTNDQIKEALLKEKAEAEEEERMQMEDINDELLRAAEIEEALMSGVAPGSNINYGSSMPFSSPKLGYSDPPQTLASMTAPQSFTTQYPQQGTQRDALGTQQAAMPYFGTIAAPNQATQGYQPQAQSQRHMQQPLPGSTPSMMPSNYQQNNPMMGNPAPGQRIPTAIVNGVPVFSDNATDPFAGRIQGNRIMTGQQQGPPPQNSKPPMQQHVGMGQQKPMGMGQTLPSGFVPSGPQQPRR